jgi:hypothetical protein
MSLTTTLTTLHPVIPADQKDSYNLLNKLSSFLSPQQLKELNVFIENIKEKNKELDNKNCLIACAFMYASYLLQLTYNKQVLAVQSRILAPEITKKAESYLPLLKEANGKREEIVKNPTFTKFINAPQNEPFKQNLENLNIQLTLSTLQIMQPIIKQAALNAVAKVVGKLTPQISQHVTAALQQPTPAPLQNFTPLVPKPAPIPSAPAENIANYVNYVFNLASLRNAPILTPLATKGLYDDVRTELHNGMKDIHAMFMKPLGNPDFLVFHDLFKETIQQIRNDLLLN